MLKLLSSNKKNNTKFLKNQTEEEKKQKPIYSFYKKCESVQSVQSVQSVANLENTIINKVVDVGIDVDIELDIDIDIDVNAGMNKNMGEKVGNMFIDNANAYSSDSEYECDNHSDTSNACDKGVLAIENEDNDYKNINNYLKNSTPWVEKYRPAVFEEIVLDPLNKKLLKNIIDNNYFPNLLFYGPPGTGKTTTIINLVNMYQEKMNLKNKGLMIHLNASDERGIDIIRNQINSFVNSKSLFGEGMKFVILDEVDYMTKTAQIALRYLLNNYNNNYNVRFCLICNYISRIDESLQTEFVRMRFNQLPESDIIKFLQKINENENLKIKPDILVSIQKYFMSDIRSMINYMQTNQDLIHECKIIKNDLWVKLTKDFIKNKKHSDIVKKINKISRDYNIEPKNLLKIYLNYIIRNHNITNTILYNIENIMHLQSCKTEYVINYIIYKLWESPFNI